MSITSYINCLVLLLVVFWIGFAIKGFPSAVRVLRRDVLAVLMAFAVAASLVADKTNGLMRIIGRLRSPAAAAVAVTAEDVARGWRIEGVGTNEAMSYAMPANAVYVGNWHIHGARSSLGNHKVNLGSLGATSSAGWSFPLGTNSDSFSSFWYFVDGRMRPTPRDAAREIRAAGGPMFAAPGLSRLWAAAESDGSRVLTWENLFVGNDTNTPVNAQIRLYANGDFTTCSNEVVTACRRVEPFDWDGDGLANEIDPEPYANNGDCHGQGEGWVEACCTNAAEIAAAGGWTNWVAAAVAQDADSWWYSFTITVDAFDAAGHSLVSIDDKHVVLTREANSATFLLMRGRRYPFSIKPAGTSFSWGTHDGIQPAVEYSDGIGAVWIEPELHITPPSATLYPAAGFAAAGFSLSSLSLHPALIGTSTWTSRNGWLDVVEKGGGVEVSWIGPSNYTCDVLCCDTHVYDATTRAEAIVWFDPDGETRPHVELQSPRTIFVNDDDDNGNGVEDFCDSGGFQPGVDDDLAEVVVRFKSLDSPTNGTLRLTADGVRIWTNPYRGGTPAGTMTMPDCSTPFERSFFVERDSLSHSGVDECRIALEWLECCGDALGCVTNRLTAAQPVVEPICGEWTTWLGTNCLWNPRCVVRGGRAARFKVDVLPDDYPAERIAWSCSSGDLSFVGCCTGRVVTVSASAQGEQDEATLSIAFDDCPSAMPQMHAKVVHEHVVRVSPIVVVATENEAMPDLSALESGVNDIYSQVGLRFVFDPAVKVVDGVLFQVDFNDEIGKQLLVSHRATVPGLPLFLVGKVDGAVAFARREKYVVMPINETASVASHEIGHFLGLEDIYPQTINGIQISGSVNVSRMNVRDWNNGTGSRYYPPGLGQKDLIGRLMMCGIRANEAQIDIPAWMVEGIPRTNYNADSSEAEMMHVGESGMLRNGGGHQ